MNYYATLEIHRDATEEEVKKAYRHLAMKYHPDRNPGDAEAEKKFKEIQIAYDAVSKGYKPLKSDPTPEPAHSAGRRYNASTEDLDSIQQQFFGGEQTGRSVLIHLFLTRVELAEGTRKKIKWKKREKCKVCDGYGAADLNKSSFVRCGVCDGSGNVAKVFGLPGRGLPMCESCEGNGFVDMFCTVCRGTGLSSQMVVEEMDLEIPSRTPSGHQIVLRGRGEPGKKGNASGNIHVCVIEES